MFNNFSQLSTEELDKKIQETYDRINKVVRFSKSPNYLNPLLMFRDELLLERRERSIIELVENQESVNGNKYSNGVIVDTENDFVRKKEEENKNNKKSRHELWNEYQDNKKKLFDANEEDLN